MHPYAAVDVAARKDRGVLSAGGAEPPTGHASRVGRHYLRRELTQRKRLMVVRIKPVLNRVLGSD